MPEIGATLREARMRQRIDISEIEAQTKIRAKYLRALENEEWELLPGSTFVKSFLRTYAEALGLDARLLIEEYKLRHERPSEHELLPIAPPSQREGRRRGPPSGAARDVIVAALVVALVALLIALGSSGGGSDVRTSAKPGGNGGAGAAPTTTAAPARPSPAKPRLVRLAVEPIAPVWVCLQGAGNRRLIPGRVVAPGEKLPTFRSRRFEITLGNGSVVLRVNGRALQVPEVSNPIGYSIDRRGRRTTLAAAARPTCA